MKKQFLFLTVMLAWAAAPSAHGQTRSWMQNSQPSAAQPSARPAAAPAAMPSAVPTNYAAPRPAAPAPQAAFARVLPSMSNSGAPAGTPPQYAAPYYTAQVPTPAPPLGGTTVPGPVIAPSITGSQPTFPTPPGNYGAPGFGGPAWNDGSMPAETLPPSTMSMPAQQHPMQPMNGAPTLAPPLSGQPNYGPQGAYAPQPNAPQGYAPGGGFAPQQNFAPPAGYGPPPGYAAQGNFAPAPMAAGCGPEEAATEYDPGAVWSAPGQKSCGPWFFSVAYMMLTRDAPNNVPLTYENSVPQITVMNSEQAGSHLWEDGGEIRFGRALGDRWAIEGVYWGLDTMSEQIGVTSQANTLNSRLDFEDISFQGAPLSTVFDNSRDQRLLRQDYFENIEINLMQQALQVDPNSRFGLTSFAGVRYFRFDEKLHLEATAAGVDYGTVPDDDPNYSDYRVITHNRMLGGQFGARGTMNLGCKLRVFAIPRFGIYGNDIQVYQHVCRTLNMGSDKLDVALMGQLDVGVSYQVLPCMSLFCSYRGMGFAGVATSDDNFARSFGENGVTTNTADIAEIKSSGSLILHGWQSGVQVQF